MIRTVVAVLLTVAIVGASVPALERGAAVNSENAVEAEITKIGDAATSLYTNEQAPPRNVSGPQRQLTVTLPRDTLQLDPVANLTIDRREKFSVVSYRIEGQPRQRTTIDAPIVNTTFGNTTTLQGAGERDIRLELRKHNSTSVVVLSRA